MTTSSDPAMVSVNAPISRFAIVIRWPYLLNGMYYSICTGLFAGFDTSDHDVIADSEL